MKAYRYKLRPSRYIAQVFEHTLDVCRELYNAGLQERREAWKLNRVSINFHAQATQLPAIKAVREDLDALYSQVAQDTLRRLAKAFDAFFRRVQQGHTAGFPRFKSKTRYDSFCYPQSGFKLAGDKLTLAKIGSVRVRLSRPVAGAIKTCTIKREADGWYVILTAETEPQSLPRRSEQIGIDVGLTTFATLSDGTEIANPRSYKEAQKALRDAQRKVARRKKGSHRRRKSVQLLARAHQHVKRQRADFHHKISHWLVNNYGTIAVENLNVKGMVKNHCLAKSISDAGWSAFFAKLFYKAANAGRQLIKIDPRGTSQACICGAHTPKTLSQRWHQCSVCGVSLGRDHVSAQVILHRAVGQTVKNVTYSSS